MNVIILLIRVQSRNVNSVNACIQITVKTQPKENQVIFIEMKEKNYFHFKRQNICLKCKCYFMFSVLL